MFSAVSLGVPSSRRPMPKATYSGSAHTALKKLNGARFTTPAPFKVVIHAIGRGTTSLVSTLQLSALDCRDGSIFMMTFVRDSGLAVQASVPLHGRSVRWMTGRNRASARFRQRTDSGGAAGGHCCPDRLIVQIIAVESPLHTGTNPSLRRPVDAACRGVAVRTLKGTRTMLRSLKDLQNFAISAIDGRIGHVRDFYFDDDAWVIRYFVVDAGS